MAEMGEADPVIPGEGGVGDEGRSEGEQPAMERNGREAVEDRLRRQAAQLVDQEPQRKGDGAESDRRPSIVPRPPHVLSRQIPRPPSLHERLRKGKADLPTPRGASALAAPGGVDLAPRRPLSTSTARDAFRT